METVPSPGESAWTKRKAKRPITRLLNQIDETRNRHMEATVGICRPVSRWFRLGAITSSAIIGLQSVGCLATPPVASPFCSPTAIIESTAVVPGSASL